MAQDVANNLGRSARVDLTRRKAVPKCMTTEDRSHDAGALRIFTDPMANDAGCESAVRKRQGYEDGACQRPTGPTSPQIEGQRPGDSR